MSNAGQKLRANISRAHQTNEVSTEFVIWLLVPFFVALTLFLFCELVVYTYFVVLTYEFPFFIYSPSFLLKIIIEDI